MAKPALAAQRGDGARTYAQARDGRALTIADLEAAYAAGWEGRHKARLPRVMIAVPCDRMLFQPFVQSLVLAFMPRELECSIYFPQSHILHMARSECIRSALADPEVDYLLMVDSDQLFGLNTLPRLLSWNAPVVAPVIVQRNGPPVPVCYREVGRDDKGFWRYEPMTDAVAAYVSQFKRDRWYDGLVANLPLTPDHDTAVVGIPDDIRLGLDTPLMPVDAMGCGMMLLRRDVMESLVPDVQGNFCTMLSGGEDFDLCRGIRAAGWGGRHPGTRGWGLLYDRGCLVGHLNFQSKGMHDLEIYRDDMEEHALEEEAKVASLPPAIPDLLQELKAEQRAPTIESLTNGDVPIWMRQRLPDEADRELVAA